MTPLADLLAEQIRAGGPITVADFMAQALGHPQWGYYQSRDPFGRSGDFTTAPEISQMFGELIAVWCVVTWQMLGSPDRVILAELGPGRGTLMADLLRVAQGVPDFHRALEVWLVETSPTLTARQRQTLRDHDIHWCESFADLPDGPMILVANELFDALAIRQFVKQDGLWRERMVGLDERGGFRFLPGPECQPDLPPPVLEAVDGSVAEICPAGRDLAKAIGQRLNRQPGFALIIDYGHPQSGVGDSLQAVKSHRFHPVLSDPGQADLTAHVDFESLALAAMPARAWGPVTQGDFLRAMGIETRAGLLAQQAGPRVASDIMGQMRRLIDSKEMGTLFKVMALASPILPAPPALAP